MADAIDLRNQLEQQAVEEQAATGSYIRPIVLFQAQPKGKEESTTFERLRDKLVEAGIPAGHIAIKTADVNELKNVTLLSPDCPIRYIITVNALKEGWDCPFAYILASLANKTSQVDVEQILGRVLRQPLTKRHGHSALNMSYVLTSSNDFKATLDGIVRGLNGAGFSERDCRVAQPETPAPEQPEYKPNKIEEPPANYGEASQGDAADEKETEDFLNFNPSALGQELQNRKDNPANANSDSGANVILQEAYKENVAFEQVLNNHGENQPFAD